MTTRFFDKVDRRDFMKASAGVGATGLILGLSPKQAMTMAPNATTDAAGNFAFAPSVYLQIGTDGGVRMIVHRTEMGQGARTALPMMLAEELEVSVDDIELVQAIGDKKYGNQNTDGSTTVRLNWEPIRQAGAAAREMLTEAAASKWGVPASECSAEAGKITHSSGKSVGYGEVASEAAELAVPEKPKLRTKDFKVIGKPTISKDVVAMTTGAAKYGIDTALPGMLHASIERSPTVVGKATSVDDSAALAVPGVKKVMKWDRLAQPLNVIGGVAVVAETTFAAMQGREALSIEWDRGGATESSDSFRKKLDALVDGEGKSARSEGDFAAAKSGAAKVLTAKYHGPHLAHAPMEPPAATALVKDGKCEVWGATQDPQTAVQRVAAAIGLKPEDVTMNVTLLGGGFGRKSKPDFIIEAALIAKELEGTPIKVTWTREDEIRYGFYRAQNMQKLEATIDGDNNVTGWRQHTAFPTILSTFMAGAKDPSDFELGMGMTNLPYLIPNISLESSGIASDLRIGWLRSVCNTFHAYAGNCFLDEVAEAVGKDPVELRLELLGDEPRELKFSPREDPYPLETARLANVIREAAKLSEWGKELPEGVGHGFAAHFSFLSYLAMAAQASVDDEGNVRVHQFDCVMDCGTVVNPDTVRAQIEGSVVFGLSMMLHEITAKDGEVQQSNFHDYQMLRIDEMPVVNIHLVESDAPPTGVGEPGVPPVAPAVANAIYKATGKRLYDLPIGDQLA